MNEVILVGRLATVPEHMLVGADQTPRCAFRLAVRRRFKNADGKYDADFVTVVCWRALADLAAKHLNKGSMCGVVGSISTRDYVDNDGVKRYITEIIADKLDFLGSKTGETAPPPQEAPYVPMQGEQQRGFVPVDDDELLF